MNSGGLFSRRTLIHAATVVDAGGLHASPGALLVEGIVPGAPREAVSLVRVVAAGTPEAVGAVADAPLLRLDRQTLLPALVNAHAHLDLTHIGPVPFTTIVPGRGPRSSGSGFDDWIRFVIRNRAKDDSAIAASVDRGIALSRAGGVAAVGDIAGMGSLVPGERQRAARLRGVSFVEFFGMGRRQEATTEAMMSLAMGEAATTRGRADDGPVPSCAIGLQPHAPYTCGREIFLAAAALGRTGSLRLCTHLAETLEEVEFAEHCTGPFATFLQDVGMWDETIAPLGGHPLEGLVPALSSGHWVAAHVNYISSAQIALLATLPVDVAYCPRASAYFGHPHAGQPPHAYRAMLDAGVNVALGTDSIICLDTPDRISTLDDMRFLRKRDGTDPRRLLAMATTNGAHALGLDESLFTLAPGEIAGLIAVDGTTLEAALGTATAPVWLADGNSVPTTAETRHRPDPSDGVPDS